MAYRAPREQHESTITLRVRTVVISQSPASLSCQPRLENTCIRIPVAAIKRSDLGKQNVQKINEKITN
jgi:hypothetical protein